MEFKGLIPLLVIGAILVFGLIKIENLTEDTSPSYLLKVLEYVKSLEIIIDEHKTKGD